MFGKCENFSNNHKNEIFDGVLGVAISKSGKGKFFSLVR